MGTIQKQSIRSTIGISAGFAIGAFNLLVLAPKLLTIEQLGLTRLITDLGITLATLCTLGSLPVIYKFFPFYKDYLPANRNDLPFITATVSATGFVVMCTIGYLLRGIIVQKFSARSPLFVTYSWLVYPFCLFYLIYLWLEGFGWALKKGAITNLLKELLPRILFTVAIILFSVQIIDFKVFLIIFTMAYFLPVIILTRTLRNTGEFSFNFSVSKLTSRMKNKMINFGLFIFGAQFLNLLSRTADIFIISSVTPKGLKDAAVFTIATYVITLMEIPQRSITAIATPVLSEAWKNKNIQSISRIYSKSVANLLIIGLSMFCIILINIHNLAGFLGKEYVGIELLAFFLGLSKLIDLGTGANGQIIATSNYWKVDFTTTAIFTIVSLPLNYILIKRFQLQGAAFATLIAIVFYNIMRFGFLWYKFKLQPYTWKDGLAILYAAVAGITAYFTPPIHNIFIDATVRTTIFSGIFFPCIYFSNISGEVNTMIKKYLLLLKGFIIRRNDANQ